MNHHCRAAADLARASPAVVLTDGGAAAPDADASAAIIVIVILTDVPAAEKN